jgi:predicted anti-sigma-YlaC factor YlaD
LTHARAQRQRASKLYLRGRDYALRALDVNHPGFRTNLQHELAATLAQTTEHDVPYLYWAGAGWAGALSADKENMELVADLPTAAALVGRVLALDDGFEAGAAHEFFIAYEGGRPNGDLKAARQHYERALALSRGDRASVYVVFAEAVCVREQDPVEFRALLAKALAVDPNKMPQMRVANVLAQEHARWLGQRMPRLFATAELTE